MGLFADPVTVHLNPAEVETLMRPVNCEKEGGMQGLIRDFQRRLQPNGTLTLEDEELLRCARYAYDYGPGGYEEQCRAVIRAARREGWNRG